MMHWSITVNSDRINNIGDVTVTDTLGPGQLFVSAGASHQPRNETTFINGQQVLIFDLGNLDGAAETVTYGTRHDGTPHLAMVPFTNSAVLETAQGLTEAVTAGRNVPFVQAKKQAAHIVTPGGDNSIRIITYRVHINNGRHDITEPFTFIDTLGTTAPPVRADFDRESVKLYRADIAANGDFVFIPTADDNDKSPHEIIPYPAGNIKIDVGINDNKMTVDIDPNGEILNAIVLEYQVVVRNTLRQPLTGDITNNVDINGICGAGETFSSLDSVDLANSQTSGGNIGRFHTINIFKIDEKGKDAFPANQYAAGAVFELYRSDGSGYFELLTRGTTDNQGELTFTFLMPGTVNLERYYIRESEAPVGYTGKIFHDRLDTDGFTVIQTTFDPHEYIPITGVKVTRAGTNIHDITLRNERESFNVEFGKVAHDPLGTGAAAFTALQGAGFSLTADRENDFMIGFLPGPSTSDADGRVTFNNLKWGSYILKETIFPTGFVQHTGEYILNITPTGVVTIERTGTGTTYPRGPGSPTGTILSPRTGNTVTHSVSGVNLPAVVNEQGSLIVRMIDEPSGGLIGNNAVGTLYPARFRVEEQGVPANYREFDVRADGTLLVPSLKFGETYVITELRGPTGYIAKGAGWSQTITIGSTTAHGDIHRVLDVPYDRASMYSFPFRNEIQLYADNERTGRSPVNDMDSRFTLYRQDGTALGTPVAGNENVAPDANGVVTFANVPFGDYFIVQTTAPSGYALPQRGMSGAAQNADMEVKLERSAQAVAPTVTITNLNPRAHHHPDNGIDAAARPFINEKGTFEITKRDNLYPGTPAIAGAIFHAVGGGQNISATSQSNGVATFIGLTVGTTYIITEETPPVGYGLHSTPASITFTPQAGGRIGTTPPQVHGAGTIGNDRATVYTFEVIKLSVLDYPMEDVEFTLSLAATGRSSDAAVLLRHGFDANGRKTALSDVNGLIAFDNLPFGSYSLTHAAATGYRFDDRPVTFTVARDGTIEITGAPSTRPGGWDVDSNGNFSITSYLGDFTVNKEDAVNGDPISGVRFRLYKETLPDVWAYTVSGETEIFIWEHIS
jgi:uncharacterized surface anchored protein